ncbi:MAG TPA: ATP-dependent DNA helicase RecQ [Chitinophagaceae bacterium]|nr:ATP-dependent DNA helicase RecQ [Chitinophagaceae bacterium]
MNTQESRLTIHKLLKEYWGFDSFRPFQEEIILQVMAGKDALALMPTGGGKSLCYQVPALAADGLCLVISPLIALMKDQVQNLRKKNITAYSIYAGMSRKEVIHTFKTVIHSNCKFLYISPERLESSLFKEFLPGLNVKLVAVDEAHCISQWGYDFRPPYLRIASIREELPGVPVLALTASATPGVQEDICTKLGFKDHPVFRQSFERSNLSYSVFKVDSKINKILEILNKVPGSSIVYCKSRKRAREISELLRLQQVAADHYHAGLSQDDRSRKQEDWIHNKTRVIVCTNAFGMGIDKPDVRSVIHADAPDCLESYYQEAGRAGRDGKTAYAVLLHDERDMVELGSLTERRFPPIEEIRKVYQSVANYLQVPAGGGASQYYDFDIADFLRKFKLNSYLVIYSLKALEQEDWLSFNEQVFFPSTIQFTTGKDYLHAFEKDQPGSVPLVKTLLRIYEGIFDQPTFISEAVIANMIKKSITETRDQLIILQRAGVIDYRPKKENAQLQFLRSRVRTEELSINRVAYQQRKEKAGERTRQMIQYMNEKHQCRSLFIGAYFGDLALKACGICDHCLRLKAAEMTAPEFEQLSHRILDRIREEPLPARDLVSMLGGIKKEKAWKVIEFLQAENKVDIDPGGWVRRK